MIQAPPPETIARYARFVVLALLAYAFWNSSGTLFGHRTAPVAGITAQKEIPSAHVPMVTVAECERQHNPFTTYSAFAIPFFPQYVPLLNFQDTKPGTGAPASCGQNAKVRYAYTLKNGEAVYAHDSADVRIGGNTVLPGLQQGLIGMKVGGERTLHVPPKLAFDAAFNYSALDGYKQIKQEEIRREPIFATVRLDALTPPEPVSAMELRVLNDAATSAGAEEAECGQQVSVNITLWKTDGTRLFTTLESHPITYVLGSGTLPYGLEKGMLGMSKDRLRTLIIPPAYAKPLYTAKDAPLAAVSWPSEVVLAELQLTSAPAYPNVTPPIKP